MGVSDLCARWRAFNASQVAVGARSSRCPAVTPDSPVNYSGATKMNSRGWRVLEAALPWSTGHVRCTPDSPVNYSAPASENSLVHSPVRQTRGAFGWLLLLCLNPILGLFIG
jgi:hypothetical protein